MGTKPLTIEEVCERGTELYETKIRPQVESGNLGRYLAIDVDTGEYSVADKRRDAVKVIRDKHPDANIWGLRIGHMAAASLGGGDTREKK